MGRKNIPIPVYVISAILFIIATYTLVNAAIFAIELANGGDLYKAEKTTMKRILIDSSGGESVDYIVISSFTGGVLAILLLLVLTLIFIILGAGLLKGRTWARVIVIIISVIVAIDSFFETINGYYIRVPEFLIFLTIALYLIISRDISYSFGKRKVIQY